MIQEETRKKSRAFTILLVDDDPDCRMLVRDVIAEASPRSTVCEVGSGEEATEYFRCLEKQTKRDRPDLIYMDIQMPGVSGQEVLKIIKSDPDLRDIPVVMLTGLNDEAQTRQAAHNGANSYTLKEADPVEFIRRVKESVEYWLYIHRHPLHQSA